MIIYCSGESSNQPEDLPVAKPIRAYVKDENIRALKASIFTWIFSELRLSNVILKIIIIPPTRFKKFLFQSVKESPDFQVIDQSELGKVLLKCPMNECNECIPVLFARYPKYYRTKRSRRGAVHQPNARWYINGVQAHLLKYHNNECG